MRNDNWEKNLQKKKKGNMVKMFFVIVITIVTVFCLISSIALVAYKSSLDKKLALEQQKAEELKRQQEQDEKLQLQYKENSEAEGEIINVVVMGSDKDGFRTDVLMLVSFNTSTYKMSVISIPRDTKFVMTENMLDSMTTRGRSELIPYGQRVKGQCKINEVHAYAGDGYRNDFTVLAVEELLEIDVNYYVKVGLDGFKDIVDAIGGVDMYVPIDMDYDDPYQDLSIHLKEGQQVLDGEKAEQLVRFRYGYADMDLGRIRTQQVFMEELLKKVTSTKTIISNFPDLVRVVYKYVETDFGLTDCLKYAKYIDKISMDKITMETIPGVGGPSYFEADKEGLKEFVDRLVFGKEPPPPPEVKDENGNVVNSKELKIEVANGGMQNGYAAKTQERLNKLGFNVVTATSWSGGKENETRICVKESGKGDDLIGLFKSAKIVVDPTLVPADVDIKIITGINEL